MRAIILWVAAGVILIVIALALVTRVSGPTPIVTVNPTPTTQTTVVPPATSSGTVILFPTATDQLIAGQQYNLRWTRGGDTTQIFLIDTSLETQGESVSVVDRKYNVPNTGSYVYTVPTTLSAGSYRFQIGGASSQAFQVVGTATSNAQVFCTTSDLSATGSEEGAAGNIYGTLTLKNTSTHRCQIVGNNFVIPTYTAGNISVSQQGDPGKNMIVLSPGQEINSKFHFPNGPQCQGSAIQSQITFSYKISTKDTVTFVDKNSNSNFPINICQSADQVTEVQVWSLQ